MILLDLKDKQMILESVVDSLETILKDKCCFIGCEAIGSLVDIRKFGTKEFNEKLYKETGEQGYYLVWNPKKSLLLTNKIALISLQGDEDERRLNIPYDLLDEYAVDKLMYGVGALLSLNLIHYYK